MQLHRSFRTTRRITYALFVAPALIIYVLVVIFPFFQGIPYSLTNWNLLSNVADYVGIKNYRTLMNSKEFWTVVKNTFQFTLAAMDAKRNDDACYSSAYIEKTDE